MHSQPITLTIAGSDSSAGAGIQADLKSIAASGSYGINVVTSVVSELPGQVSKVQLLEPDLIADQMRVLFSGFPIAAAKTGMLGGLQQVETVATLWRELAANIPLVVDPVMVATGGGRLLTEDAVSAIESSLLPLATLITPNMDEAAVLWRQPLETRQHMEACARHLANRYGTAVLIKGGHLWQEAAADVLVTADHLEWLETERIQGVHTHGTGCSYSATIAAELAKGSPLLQAVKTAKQRIFLAIRDHLRWPATGGGVIDALNHLRALPHDSQ